VADHITLKELITEVGRYRHGHLAVDPDIEELRVMGTYLVDQPDHLLTMLENVLPIKARFLLPWWVTLERSDH